MRRRPVALAFDIAIISFVFIMLILANTFTFGLFGGFIAILSSVIILILYDMFLIGGPGARNHRNAMSQAASMQPRRCPPLLLKSRNKFRTSLLSCPGLAGIVLIVGLFSNRRRLAHVFLSGVVVIKKNPKHNIEKRVGLLHHPALYDNRAHTCPINVHPHAS